MFETLLVVNTLWFLMGFNVFSLRNQVFAKLLVPRDQRDTPVFDILAASGRFLGGFNLAFAVFNGLLLTNLGLFPEDKQRALFLFVFAVAHGSQFAFNLPIAIQNKRGGGVWPVLKGTMLFIFSVDFILTLFNLVLAARLAF